MHILMLQGPASGFFAQLARGLTARGHRLTKVNFCGGCDALWRGEPAIRYRGDADDLPRFYADLLANDPADAVVLFGAARPVHRAAIEVAAALKIPVWAFDEGYIRPDYITLDLGGTGAESALPRTAHKLRVLSMRLQAVAVPQPTDAGWGERARAELRYRIGSALRAGRYRRYRNHRPFAAWQEYLGFIRRYAKDRWRAAAYRAALADAERAATGGAKVFFVPLQLDHDYALRRHSEFPDMMAALERIMASFARHAPADAMLLIKRHPLDAEFSDRLRAIRRAARRHGVAPRVRYFAGGDLVRALSISAGVVTVNSTVGTLALDADKPVKLLGRAVYGIPGLVSTQALEHFWQAPAAPDRSLYEAFRRAAVVLTQINGNFYSRAGRRHAVLQALDRIEAQGAYISLLTEAALPMQTAPDAAGASVGRRAPTRLPTTLPEPEPQAVSR